MHFEGMNFLIFSNYIPFFLSSLPISFPKSFKFNLDFSKEIRSLSLSFTIVYYISISRCTYLLLSLFLLIHLLCYQIIISKFLDSEFIISHPRKIYPWGLIWYQLGNFLLFDMHLIGTRQHFGFDNIVRFSLFQPSEIN